MSCELSLLFVNDHCHAQLNEMASLQIKGEHIEGSSEEESTVTQKQITNTQHNVIVKAQGKAESESRCMAVWRD